jgi:hypothetical protein
MVRRHNELLRYRKPVLRRLSQQRRLTRCVSIRLGDPRERDEQLLDAVCPMIAASAKLTQAAAASYAASRTANTVTAGASQPAALSCGTESDGADGPEAAWGAVGAGGADSSRA